MKNKEVGNVYASTNNESMSPSRESRFCSVLFKRAEVESWVSEGEG